VEAALAFCPKPIPGPRPTIAAAGLRGVDLELLELAIDAKRNPAPAA